MNGHKHRAVTAALLATLAVGGVPAYATAAQDAPSAKHQEQQGDVGSQEAVQASLPKSLAAALKDGSLGKQGITSSLASDAAAKTYAPDDVVTLIV